MIKCPNCGSTAQVKEISQEQVGSADIIIIYTLCKCGCGEQFFHYQCLNEFSNIIKEGYLK